MKRAGAQPALTAATAATTWLVLTSWSRLLADPGDLAPQLLVGITLVAAAGAGLRRAPLPRPVVALGQLVVAALTVHAFVGTGLPPGPASAQVVLTALSDGVGTGRTFRAPVTADAPSMVPVLLLAGLAVHLVVDLVGVTLRWATLAGLPLLAAYVVPVSVLQQPTPWPLLVAAGAGYLAMLALDERTRSRRWGRAIRDPFLTTARLWPRGALPVAALALAAAVLLPPLVPHRSLATLPGSGSGGSGSSIGVDPLVDLRRDLVQGADLPLFTVKVPDDATAPTYVRLSVLDRFDGDAWKVGPRVRPATNSARGDLPPDGLGDDVPGDEVPWAVSTDDRFTSVWLPVPRHLRSIDAGDDWRYDADTRDFQSVGRATTAGLDYALTEFRADLDAPFLAAAGPADPILRSRYTALPEGTAWLRDIATQVTGDADGQLARAVALQTFFQEEFTYDTGNDDGSGMGALKDFLAPGGRRGYCEQFAASMALMARTLDIPARVSVGFLSPRRDRDGTFEFSTHDLHAWPELWFEGAGWVMFEPTPTSHTRGTPAYSRARPAEPTASASPSSSTALPSASPRPVPRDRPEAPRTSSDTSTLAWLAPLGALLLGLAVLTGPRLVRSRRRTARLASGSPEQAWAELRAATVDRRLPWPDGRSPRATARVVRGHVAPDARTAATAALQRLVLAVEAQRYAAAAEPADRDALAEDVSTCITALDAAATRRQRRLARWWPASLWAQRPMAGTSPAAPTGAQEELNPLVGAGSDQSS